MTTHSKKLLLGAHISVAGGYFKAVERALSIGCTTFQIFTKSNRQWAANEITDSEAGFFKKAVTDSGIGPVVAHASYLINLASTTPGVRTQSRHALAQEIARCDKLAIPYLVLHPGSNSEATSEEGLNFIVEGLSHVLESVPKNSRCMILLETMAGQGSSLCSTFEEIAYVRHHVSKKTKVGVCVDTCHLFAAGYDLRTESEYEKTWHHFDKTVGLEHIKAIHINDSKKDLGSHVDRHENIGKGCLGDHSFELLFNDKRFFEIPKILETPKAELAEDLHNMRHIVGLLNKETKSRLTVEVK
jgi:deoxyribonuclease-4